MSTPHHVVIVGGGFGGLHAAQRLRRAPVEVTLIDRRNVHLFQPLLYQVATGGLSPGDIASPLRWILRRHRNTRVWVGDVTTVDPRERRVVMRDGTVSYDTLIVAAGVRHHYFGHEGWELDAPGLKTIEDATEIRRRILTAFETAEREPDPTLRGEWLTFAVVGGGPTGVELAGAISELARDTLRRDFRTIDPRAARILLIEGTDRALPAFPPKLSTKSMRSLERLGVQVLTGTYVTEVTNQWVTVKVGDDKQRIATRTVLWAAGIKGSPLGAVLAGATGTKLDQLGRIQVAEDLSIPGQPEIFVIGDLANVSHQTGRPLPGLAPVAIQEGRYVADLIAARLKGKRSGPFRYRDRGQLATIGRAAAVADLRGIRFSGYPAWLLWLFVHLVLLIEFQNRVLVLVQWAWHYFTRNRGARIIAHSRDRDSI